ncbi:MAG TPA: 30S ribosomal protein S9 [Syntrophaceae bacterium]|nr:30S ribosomal protein S9 [Syntrophaceae bacterium]
MPEIIYGATGKRKMAIARVWLKPGSGNILVNGKKVEEYFGIETLKNVIRQPLYLTNTGDKYNISVNVKGGGISGQAEAIRHGIAKALLQTNPEFRSILKKAGLLTRDPRTKERKKYGQPGARARYQYSKR